MTPNSLPPEAIVAIQHGDKIKAVAITREKTGLGLKEAKDLVDAYFETEEVDFEHSPAQAIIAAIETNRKLEAIKMLCDVTPLNLKNAKSVLEIYDGVDLDQGADLSAAVIDAAKNKNLAEVIRLLKESDADVAKHSLGAPPKALSTKSANGETHQASYRCAFSAWIISWAIMVFLPSAVFAYLGLYKSETDIEQGVSSFLAATWQVADDVGPIAKLMMGAWLALLSAFAFLHKPRNFLAHAITLSICGALGVLFTLLIIPAEYSRGFGIGLTGARLDQQTLPIYAVGGLISGLMLSILYWHCHKKHLISSV
jgi:ribosomal protein L7/L12